MFDKQKEFFWNYNKKYYEKINFIAAINKIKDINAINTQMVPG